MTKYLFVSILFLGLFSCSNSKQKVNEIFAQEKPVLVSEQEQFFNLKHKNPVSKMVPKNIHLKEQEFVCKIASANTGINWFLRGPQNLGGRTRALALDVKNSNRIIVGGVSGGVWISEDLGKSFEKATTPQQFHSVTCIAQDTRAGFENIWYYGTGEQNGNSSDLLGNGIYKSTDNGLNWTLLESTQNDVSNIVSSLGDFRYVKDIKVSATTGYIVAASFSGVWLSKDGGTTWTNELTGGANPNGFGYVNFGKQTNIDVSKTGVFYATLSSDCIDEGIWRSTDGENWTEITPAGFSSAYRRIESGISESDENQVFFIADIATTIPLSDDHQLWKYNHTKNSWTNKTANIPAGSCTGFFDFDFGYFQSQNSYDLFISVHPSDTNLVFLGGTNLYRSTDGFSTPAHNWIGGYNCDLTNPENYIHQNHHPDNHAVVFVPGTNTMVSAHDGGISITSDCKASNVVWEDANKGYNTTQFYTVAIEQGNSENENIIGGLQDNGTWMTNSINQNQDWMNVFYGDGAYCAIAEGRESYYISWQGGKTFKADIDDDGNLNNLTRIDPTGATDFMFINSFILDPTENNTMYLAAGTYIWRNDSLNHIVLDQDHYNSTDLGWARINESNTGGFLGNPRISTLDMSLNSSNVLYYATETGGIFRLDNLDSKAYTKTNIRSSSMPNGFVSCLEVDNRNALNLMATFSNYEVESIYYSENSGDNWTDVSGNLEEFENGSGAGPSVNWAHIHYDGEKNIYLVGTTSGLFSTETLDGINTVWEREGIDEIGNVPVNMIASRSFDNNIVIATHGNGIYSNKEFVSGISNTETEKIGFFLSNVSPNPVVNKMKFTYRIDNAAKVSLKIYDLSGKLIDVIQEENKAAGTYEMRWYAKTELSSGLYQLVLDVNGKKLNKQFLVE